MPKITFLPAGVTIEVPAGTSVFAASSKAELPIPSQCGGKCACALCRVKLVEGEDLVSPIEWDEEGHMGNVFYLTRERLSCQTRVYGDVVVELEDAPIKEKVRGRYIPYSLIRKREKLEEEEELLRVRKGDRAPGPGRGGGGPRRRRADEGGGKSRGRQAPPQQDRPQQDQPRQDGESRPPAPEGDGPTDSKKRRRRRRRRNPGAPRPGDSRPPPGKKD